MFDVYVGKLGWELTILYNGKDQPREDVIVMTGARSTLCFWFLACSKVLMG